MDIKKQTNKIFNKNIFYPKGGEVFEVIKETQITYLTYFTAPYSGGDNETLLKGERIFISKPDELKPFGYDCYPLNPDEVENRIIPSADRNDPEYYGFSLYIETSSLNKNYQLIELMPIKFIMGDATNPLGSKTKIIVHICNDVGEWGKGFVMAISKKWKQPETEYRKWYKNKEGIQTEIVQFERLKIRDRYSNEKQFQLGNVQFVKVTEDIWVANIIAQRDIVSDKDGLPPIRYSFVSECLERVREFAKKNKASIHMPRIGCGLAGGKWTEIEKTINDNLLAHGIETTVYDFE